MTRDKLSLLLIQKLTGTISEKDEALLDSWLAEDEHNRQIFEHLKDYNHLQHVYKAQKNLDTKKALKEMKGRIAEYEQTQNADKQQGRKIFSIVNMRWLNTAAVVAVIIGVGFFGYHKYMEVKPLAVQPVVLQAVEQSHDIGMDSAHTTQVTPSSIPAVIAQIVNSTDMDEDTREQFNTARNVETYYNKEHWETLPDGSLVHMAHGTRLVYPEHFSGTTRDVCLDGEAYFIVAKSHGNRFVVHTTSGSIREYGTEFHVNTRTGEGTSVVLVEGSIGVKAGEGPERMMTPGDQATVSTAGISIAKTDIEPYRAWNVGKFEFNGWKLERVMNVIGMWYGCKVSYDSDDMRNISISGNFDRYEDLYPTLDAISTITGLRLTVKDKNIEITKYN